MHLLRESVKVVTCLPATLTTSLHTFTKSLSPPRFPWLRRVLCSTGWCRCRIKLGMQVGPWACKLHLRHMVLAVRCLEWVVALLSERLWVGIL